MTLAIWANALLTVAQVIGGILSGSLALVADALHNFSDMASLVIALAARKIARRPADERMTFGYGRIEIVAALINYTTLIVVGVYLVYEGIMRLIEPSEVAGWTVVILGAVALVIDAFTVVLTFKMQRDSVNIRAMFLHNLSDALASVAVVCGGILIILYDIRWIDPAITLAIAAYILYLAAIEIGGPVRTLMLGSPPDMDPAAVLATIRAVDGVEDVHHVHLWQMQEHEVALDCHIVVPPHRLGEVDAIKGAIKRAITAAHGIGHSTLEFESEPCEAGDMPVFGHAG